MKRKRKYKLLLAMILAAIMVITPLQAFAKQNINHPVDVKFQILYVDSSFNIGYNLGYSERTTFICQYETPHSDTAYSNHSIAIRDIKAAADRLKPDKGYKIEGWTKNASANPTINDFPVWMWNKNTACNKGDIIYLVAKSTAPPSNTPDKPTESELLKILKNSVKIKCENNSSNHSKKTQLYDLIPESYTVGQVQRSNHSQYTCQITVYPDLYIEKFDSDTGEIHSLDPSNQKDQTITLNYSKKNKSWDAGCNKLMQYTVKCKDIPSPPPPPTPTVPDKPSPSDIETLLSNGAVTIECTNLEEDHSHITYGLIPETYQVGTVEGDSDVGYSCNITILSSAEYVAKYNTEIGENHSLDPINQDAKTIALEYKDSQWEIKSGWTPGKYTVKCETLPPPPPETPETPDKPSEDYLKEFFGENAVKIICNNMSAGHNDKLYPLLNNSFSIGDVTSDGQGGYSCPVTITPTAYVSKYAEDMSKTHSLDPVDQPNKTVTFTWDDEMWISFEEGILSYSVACENSPAEPDNPPETPYYPPSNPTYYVVQWNNYDNSELETDYCTYYTLPTYDGPIPVKPSDENYNYEFTGWDKEITRVTESQVYTAQYKSVPIEMQPDDNPEKDAPGDAEKPEKPVSPEDSGKQQPSNEAASQATSQVPKTGDEANIMLLILLGAVAALGTGICGLKILRRR